MLLSWNLKLMRCSPQSWQYIVVFLQVLSLRHGLWGVVHLLSKVQGFVSEVHDNGSWIDTTSTTSATSLTGFHTLVGQVLLWPSAIANTLLLQICAAAAFHVMPSRHIITNEALGLIQDWDSLHHISSCTFLANTIINRATALALWATATTELIAVLLKIANQNFTWRTLGFLGQVLQLGCNGCHLQCFHFHLRLLGALPKAQPRCRPKVVHRSSSHIGVPLQRKRVTLLKRTSCITCGHFSITCDKQTKLTWTSDNPARTCRCRHDQPSQP